MKIYILQKRAILVTLCIIVVLIGFIFSMIIKNKGMIGVFSNQRRLPIYSVETKDKKIAISFDAAWGDVILVRSI
jgi:hypothetical protein